MNRKDFIKAAGGAFYLAAHRLFPDIADDLFVPVSYPSAGIPGSTQLSLKRP